MTHSLARLGLLAITFAATCALAQPDGDAERGRKLFMDKMCFTCHGTLGQGGERGSGPQVAPAAWPYEAFVQQIRHPRQDMPRYSAKYVSDDELRDMYAYLTSIKPWRPAREIELLSNAP